jgi:hydrogenase/urease accessory protein HupE
MYIAKYVYLLCALTSLLATVLLWKNFRKTGVRLLFWSSICFLGFTVNNILLFVDVIMLPDVDLAVARTLPAVLGLGALLFGFIWETT